LGDWGIGGLGDWGIGGLGDWGIGGLGDWGIGGYSFAEASADKTADKLEIGGEEGRGGGRWANIGLRS
jgi:hypothetical protein